MPKFVFRIIQEVDGKQAFYKLVSDDVCDLDEFERNLPSKYESQKESMYMIMQRMSEIKPLNEYDYKPRKDLHENALEFKTRHLRYYGMKVEGTGKVIVLCGYKNDQKKDERKIKKLITSCINNHTIEPNET